MLNRNFRLLLAVCLVTSLAWAADDPFVGKWKVDPSRSKLNDEMKVEVAGANKYAITFAPGFVDTIVADGTDQPALSGTTLSITVKAPNSWVVVRKMKGRTLLTGYWTLSDDGKTLNDAYSEYAPDGSKSMFLPYVYQRTAGRSGFLGVWDSDTEKVKPGIELQIEPYDADGLSFNSPGAEITKKIKFDGNDYPDPDPKKDRPKGDRPSGDRASGDRASDDPGPASSGRRVNQRTLGNHRQIQRQNYGHPPDRALSRSQNLNHDREPGGSKPSQKHPRV